MLQQGFKGHSKGGQRERKPPSPSTGKGDWLEINPGHTLKELLPLPKGLRFCCHHAVKGLTCGLPKCTYGHKAYDMFTVEEKKLFDDHLATINKSETEFKVVP